MVEITEYLRQNKPDLSDSTVAAYTVNLEKLHDRLHGTRKFEDIAWLHDTDAVLESLETRDYLLCLLQLPLILLLSLPCPFPIQTSCCTSLGTCEK